MTSVATLLSMLRARKGKLPFEVGAFIALQASERLIEAPVAITTSLVVIAEDGSVLIDSAAPSADVETAAEGLHAVLEQLLLAAGAGVPQRMLAYVDQGAPTGADALERLRDALEAALVPLNRSASKRIIARLLRDAERESAVPSRRPPAFTEAQIDADFDALLGGGALAPSAPPQVTFDTTRTISDADDELASVRLDANELPVVALATASRTTMNERMDAALDRARASAASEAPPAKRGASSWTLFFALVAVVLAAGGFVALVRPETFGIRFPSLADDAQVEVDASVPAASAPRVGTVELELPAGAQVLLFVGRGPARIEKLPIGVAHELVVVADGRAPSRAVLPADTEWVEGEPRPTYELALQAGAEVTSARAMDVGPTGLAHDRMGTASGRHGDVRVVTNPPGARVFMVVGFGPSVVIPSLPIEAAHELLIFAEGSEPERLVVAPSDFIERDGSLVARQSVRLTPRARR